MRKPSQITRDSETKSWYFINHNYEKVSNSSSLILLSLYTASLETFISFLENKIEEDYSIWDFAEKHEQ